MSLAERQGNDKSSARCNPVFNVVFQVFCRVRCVLAWWKQKGKTASGQRREKVIGLLLSPSPAALAYGSRPCSVTCASFTCAYSDNSLPLDVPVCSIFQYLYDGPLADVRHNSSLWAWVKCGLS